MALIFLQVDAWSFLNGLAGAVVGAILIALIGFIFRNKILTKLKAGWYWIFNKEVTIKAFTVYIGLGAERDLASKIKSFEEGVSKSGFQLEKIVDRRNSVYAVLVTKTHMSFRFSMHETPAIGPDNEFYKIRIDLVNGIFTYRTGASYLNLVLNDLVSTIGQAFGNKTQNINYVFEIEHNMKALNSSYIRKQNWRGGKVTITSESITSEQKDLKKSIKLIREIAVNPKVAIS